MNFNSLVIATVNPFNQGELDKNGNAPVILNVLAGKAPNRMVLSGTIALNMGIEVGETYLFNVREVESNEYGRQFTWTKAKTCNVADILSGVQTLGQPEVFDVTSEDEVVIEEDEVSEQVANIPGA